MYNIPNIQDATQNYSAIQRTSMQTVWSLDGSRVWMKLLKESMQTEKRLQSIVLGTQILKELMEEKETSKEAEKEIRSKITPQILYLNKVQ